MAQQEPVPLLIKHFQRARLQTGDHQLRNVTISIPLLYGNKLFLKCVERVLLDHHKVTQTAWFWFPIRICYSQMHSACARSLWFQRSGWRRGRIAVTDDCILIGRVWLTGALKRGNVDIFGNLPPPATDCAVSIRHIVCHTYVQDHPLFSLAARLIHCTKRVRQPKLSSRYCREKTPTVHAVLLPTRSRNSIIN